VGEHNRDEYQGTEKKDARFNKIADFGIGTKNPKKTFYYHKKNNNREQYHGEGIYNNKGELP
jgi:hypothetical protein